MCSVLVLLDTNATLIQKGQVLDFSSCTGLQCCYSGPERTNLTVAVDRAFHILPPLAVLHALKGSEAYREHFNKARSEWGREVSHLI